MGVRSQNIIVNHAEDVPLEKMPALIEQLEAQMKEAAKNLEFEKAAKLRDQVQVLRDKLLGK